MVTVPTIRDRSVQLQNIPQVAPLPTGELAAFGGGRAAAATGKAVQDTVEAVQGFAIREALKADEIQDLTARKELAALENDITWGPNGIYRQQGKNAIGAVDRTRKAWTDGVADIESRLSNRRQKDAFERMVAGREPTLIRGSMQHVSVQTQKHEDQELGAFLVNMDNRTRNNWQDLDRDLKPTAAKVGNEEKRIELAKWARRSGIGEKELKRVTDSEVSKSHMIMLSSMLTADQRDMARDYFKDISQELTGKDRATAKRFLQRSAELGKVQKAVDDVMALEDKTDAERRVFIREIEDPEIRQKAESMLDQRLLRGRQEQDQVVEGHYNEAIRLGEAVGGGDPDFWLTPDLHDFLTQSAPGLIGQLRNRFRVPQKTQKAKWFDFLEIVRDDPDRIRLMNRAEFDGFWSKFNEVDRRWAERVWIAAKSTKSASEAQKKLTTFIGPMEQMDRFLVRAVLIPELSKDRNPAQRDRLKRWQELIQGRVRRWEEEHPDKIVDTDVINGIMVDALDDKVAVRGIISDSLVSVASLTEDDRGNITHPENLWRELDQEVRDLVKNILQSKGNGLQVTDELARRYYAATLANNTDLAQAILLGKER